jgi:hypothetical protein
MPHAGRVVVFVVVFGVDGAARLLAPGVVESTGVDRVEARLID